MTRLASNSNAKAGFVLYHLFNKKISGDNTAFILSPLVTQSVANCLRTKNSTSFVSRPRFEAISRLLHPCMSHFILDFGIFWILYAPTPNKYPGNVCAQLFFRLLEIVHPPTDRCRANQRLADRFLSRFQRRDIFWTSPELHTFKTHIQSHKFSFVCNTMSSRYLI